MPNYYGPSTAVGVGVIKGDKGDPAPTGLPAWAPTGLLNAYDAQRSLYNWKSSNTLRQRAALARATNGTLEHLVVVGDSETDNYCGDGSYDRRRMWPRRLRDQMSALSGVPSGGEGVIRAAFSGGADPRWNLGSQWGNGVSYIQSTTNGAVATCVTAETCTSIDVYYIDGTGSISVTIDGANTKTATAAGSYLLKRLQWTGLTSATHTVAITNTATSGTGSYVYGVGAYNTSGIVVHNLAMYGVQTSYFASAAGLGGAWGPLNLFGGVMGGTTYSPLIGTPAAWHYQLGVNDGLGSVATATATANIQTFQTAVTGTDFVLHGQQQPGGVSTANWNTWIGALYTLADTLNVPLFDWYDRSGGFTAALANQMMSNDYTHPTQAWQFQQARPVAAAIAS